MAGNVNIPANLWGQQRLHIEGKWPEVLVRLDLNYWADPKACEGRARPSQRDLADSYGWKRGRLRKFMERLAPTEDPSRTQAGPKQDPADHGDTGTMDEEVPNEDPARTQRVPSEDPGHNGAPARTSPSPSPSLFSNPTGSCADSVQIPSYVVAWTRTKPARSRPKGITQQQLVEFIVAGVEAITGEPPAQVPSKSYGRPLLNLWARLGFPPLGDISERDNHRISPLTALGDVRLLSDACRRCPHPFFRGHIRGFDPDGSSWGKDPPTTWTPQIVCRLDPGSKGSGHGATIEQRLEAAREWAEKGRPAPPDDRPLEGAIVRRSHRQPVETVSQQMRRIGLLGGKG